MNMKKSVTVVIVMLTAASNAFAVFISPFTSWEDLSEKSPDIVIARCIAPSNPKDAWDGMIWSDIEVLEVIKGDTKPIETTSMVSQYWPRQGEMFLMFSTYQTNEFYQAYNATETYRVVPLGLYFPINQLNDKALDEQIHFVFQYRLDELNRELKNNTDEKKRLEEGIKPSDQSKAESPAPAATGLASPSQEERDAAAELLRDSYVPSPESNWTTLLSRMTPGIYKKDIMTVLQFFGATAEGGGGSGQTHTAAYQLDDTWLLRCAFANGSGASFTNWSSPMRDSTLISAELVENLRHVRVEPPASFTGLWITYFANGNKAQERHYQDGTITSTKRYPKL